MGLIIDVREAVEFNDQHIPDSINIPLSEFETVAPGFFSRAEADKITFISLKERRARKAMKMFNEMEYKDKFGTVGFYPGGLVAWKKQSKPLLTEFAPRLSLMRQAHIVSGAGIAFFSVIAFTIDPIWTFATAIIGILQAFDGIWGVSLLPTFLRHMPWNKGQKERDRNLYNLFPTTMPKYESPDVDTETHSQSESEDEQKKGTRVDKERKSDMDYNSPNYHNA